MSTRDLVKMSAYLAMFIVLDYLSNMIGIFRMPQGGTLGLGVIALLLASYDLGWKKGVAVGLLSVLLQWMTGAMWFLNWFQFILDYLLAFGIYGIACLVPSTKIGKQMLLWGVVVTNLIRFASHTIAGVLFYEVTWWGSLAYNGWYMIPTMVVALIVVALVLPRLRIHH
jgi:thiamine transporter